MSRNYRKEYDNYHSRPEQKIRRAARNAARRLFAAADPDKDVHHKDNNPLNNDKKNLSLVTKHYNRREPRLRKESILVVSNELKAITAILDKFENILRKSNFIKKQKLAKSLGIIITMRGKHSVSVEQDEEIGTVTGPHIVGTGDDNTTVVVRRKKKKQRNSKIKEEGSLQLEKYLKEVEEGLNRHE